MPRIGWRVALKGLAGFVAGVALWVLLSPLYDRAIGAGATALMRAFEKPKVTRLKMAEDKLTTVDRSDFDPRSKRPAISIADLTFNFVLLVALFAGSQRTFSDRNIGGFLAASAALALTHILGTITRVMSIYVAKLGMWSTVNYSSFDRNFWGAADHFYRLVLMYAFAFALWWIFRDPSQAVVAPAKQKQQKKKKK
ncbi:MAG TPA: exosortase H-associated membrane protein [Thermoanaerobaculia bacterium]|nr:exosortase H-associated membrane protein [Thermoanaerobaculia bacterium]